MLAGTLSGVEENVAKGGYVASKQTGETPEGILIATGSEVNLAVEAQAKLAEAGVDSVCRITAKLLICLKHSQKSTRRVSCRKP